MGEQFVELPRVVGMAQVADLVQDDVINAGARCADEVYVKRQFACRAAGSPAPLHYANTQLGWLHIPAADLLEARS